ncbi:MAG: molybdopterin molybdotransferase MoeA [Candidatus Promineifilaceae bacterium]|nr:molybdopterin molybdotransferase MoeA [Candidatus Promineifilaceae bacterium]
MTDLEYLTVADALEMVLGGVKPLEKEYVALLEALGRVIAEPVVAKDSLPPFANSSMDGYALSAADIEEATDSHPVRLNVIADIAAGSGENVTLTSGSAARIMTGAPMPHGADAVVPVEDTNEPWRDENRPLPDSVLVKRAVGPGDYVRHIGEDIVAGEEVLSPGNILRPQEIGVLAALGVSRVLVRRRPRIGILATGDELIDIDQALSPGKIRNSNGYAQSAQVLMLGAELISLGVARDTEEDVRAKLKSGLDSGADLLVSSAGVSVGAYDVVRSVLEQGGSVQFWRVRMRPGKPLAFGSYQGVPFLGLPGNPVSAMVSFERFVRPVILKMAGFTNVNRPKVNTTIQERIHSDGRESYIRAVVTKTDEGYKAASTGSQGSHVMTSLVKANALLIIPEGVTVVNPGDSLEALMIDWPETIF